MVQEKNYHDQLKDVMDELVHLVYDLTLNFPKEELFGVTSQLRRAVLSIILNYIEGYARLRKLVMKNFYETSYGSLKETKYLLYFCYKRGYLTKKDYERCLPLTERIGKMLWGVLVRI